MNIKEDTSSTEEEISFIDILLILSANVKILLLLPLLGAICAAVFIFFQDQSPSPYVSNSSIFVEAPHTKIRAEILVSTINSGDAFALMKSSNRSITASLSPADRLLKLSVSASTPDEAQALNHAALRKIFAISLPAGPETQRLQQLLKNEQARLAEIRAMIAESSFLTKEKPENLRAYGELLSIASEREVAIAKLENDLSGLSVNNIVQAPTFPEAPQAPRKTKPLVVGIVVGGLLALLWIFARHSVIMLQADSQNRCKLDQIKANIGLK